MSSTTPVLPDNPLGIRAAAVVLQHVTTVLVLGIAALAVVAAVSVVIRFRRARAVERQQLKWLAYTAGLFAVVVALAATGPWDWWVPTPLSDLVFGILFAMLPVATGIAILRYRLHDIDRLINRTLVYGLLTAVLGLGYAGVVLVLGELFGQDITQHPPSWLVAGATLSAAALVGPARRRIQQRVDRRFNRRHYDAAMTIEAFTTRLRDKIDLDALAAELLAVTDQTMQPTQAWLWLRPSAPDPRRPER